MVKVNGKSNLAYSIIIPAWPKEGRSYGLDYIDKLNYPKDKLEVILARGLHPNKQRNKAAKSATGKILIFFDNDSCPEPDYVQRLSKYFVDESIAGVCGPNPAVPAESFIAKVVESVFQSPFAVFSKTARYKPIGKIRKCRDSDLIFCNFTIRKDMYLETGGLDENIWPNEENEFLERLRTSFPKAQLLYDPNLIAREPRPEKFTHFVRKIFGYGIGRANQFKAKPSLWSTIHMLGSLVLILPFLFVLLWGFNSLWLLIVPYVLLLLFATIHSFYKNRDALLMIVFPLGVVSLHFAYVLGLWWGILKTKMRIQDNCEVVIEKYVIS